MFICNRRIAIKIVIIILSIVTIIFILLVTWEQSRDYYYTSKGRCVTVWKRLGGRCYVMPYKYSILFQNPKENYIETNSQSWIALYWRTDKDIYVDNNYYNQNLNTIFCFDETYTIYDLNTHPTYWYHIGNPVFDTIDNTIIRRSVSFNDSIDMIDVFIFEK